LPAKFHFFFSTCSPGDFPAWRFPLRSTPAGRNGQGDESVTWILVPENLLDVLSESFAGGVLRVAKNI